MSQDVVKEAYFFAGSILMGIAVTFGYDFLLIARRIVKHSLLGISIEDFLFWVVCALAVFYILYRENNGILRWFAVLGAAFGMLIYKWIVGLHFVTITAFLLQKLIEWVGKLLRIFLKPYRWIGKRLKCWWGIYSKKRIKRKKVLENWLTRLKKVLKISLTKH